MDVLRKRDRVTKGAGLLNVVEVLAKVSSFSSGLVSLGASPSRRIALAASVLDVRFTRPAHSIERRGARENTPRLIPSRDLLNALPTATCPLWMIASGIRAVCSDVPPILLHVSSILSPVLLIGPEVPPIASQVLTIAP
jgi:hypothetical protein